MIWGGTNWGWLACPIVATSYDYSSPISEDRSIGDKFYETKLLTLFTRVAEGLTKTEQVAVVSFTRFGERVAGLGRGGRRRR